VAKVKKLCDKAEEFADCIGTLLNGVQAGGVPCVYPCASKHPPVCCNYMSHPLYRFSLASVSEYSIYAHGVSSSSFHPLAVLNTQIGVL
jgi:hypothetical protein